MINKNIKKIFALLLLTSGMIFNSCSGNKYQNPAIYNSMLMKLMSSNKEDIRAMNSALTSGNYQKAKQVRKNWERHLKEAIANAEEIVDFKGDYSLQNAIIKGLKKYKQIVANEYKQLIAIRIEGDNSLQNIENKLLKEINQVFTQAVKIVNKAKTDFKIIYIKNNES